MEGLTFTRALDQIFPNLRVVFVRRRDKVSQAVSLWKAIQDSAWSHEEGASPDASRELVFHFEAIDHLLRRIVDHEASWEAYFAENGIEPCRVVYEEFVASYERTVLEILRDLGMDVPEQTAFKPRRMKKQADALSEEWVQLFRSLKGQ